MKTKKPSAKPRKARSAAEFMEHHYAGIATDFPAYGPYVERVPRWLIGRIATEAFEAGFEAGKHSRAKRRKTK